MGLRFSKSIRLGNYLRLNFSGSGVSATVGKKGASVTLGQRGTFLNLSPSLVGINGTGLSYRKKISAAGLGGLMEGAGLGGAAKQPNGGSTKPAESLVKKPNATGKSVSMSELTGITSDAPGKTDLSSKVVRPARAILEEYEEALEVRLHLHRYAEQVMTAEEFEEAFAESDNEAKKELYRLSADGDEDTIESFIGSFMNHLELPYDVRVNYELEGDVLYADLDLPEIEDFGSEAPVLTKEGKLGYKKKPASQLKSEYAETVFSLGVFLGAHFFNLSPFIQTIVLSGFTTVRNRDGDLEDEYLYSVKFVRKIFEETKFFDLTDLYAFYLQFENRIRISEAKAFKPVKPYEPESAVRSAAMTEEAALALQELGYGKADVKNVMAELKGEEFASVSDLLREALKRLSSR